MNRRAKRKQKRFIILAILVVVALFGIKLLVSGGRYIPVAVQLATKRGIQLNETTDGRINILILGTGGGTHDGPNLTDTIIFASLDPAHDKVTMVSIPRDLWIPDLKDKINYAYAKGEDNGQKKGLLLAKALVGKVTGQDINYAVRLDFSGFVKAIDMVGGLDISVDNTFDDYAYPIEGNEKETCGHSDIEIASLSAQIASGSATDSDIFPCRYTHLHFDKGIQHMDGSTALKYVRSRHALGIEGSDFARSKRQQKVIEAFREKMLSAGTLLNPVKLLDIVNTLQDSVDTDIKTDEYDDFVRLAQKMKGSKITNASLDFGDLATGRPGLLTNPPLSVDYFYAWVLIPRVGASNYTEINSYISCEITKGNCMVSPSPAPTQ